MACPGTERDRASISREAAEGVEPSLSTTVAPLSAYSPLHASPSSFQQNMQRPSATRAVTSNRETSTHTGASKRAVDTSVLWAT